MKWIACKIFQDNSRSTHESQVLNMIYLWHHHDSHPAFADFVSFVGLELEAQQLIGHVQVP